jgi:hypothetical protein
MVRSLTTAVDGQGGGLTASGTAGTLLMMGAGHGGGSSQGGRGEDGEGLGKHSVDCACEFEDGEKCRNPGDISGEWKSKWTLRAVGRLTPGNMKADESEQAVVKDNEDLADRREKWK